MAAVMVTEGARASHRLLKCKNAAVHGRALRNCLMTRPSDPWIVRRSLADIGPLRFHRSLHRSRLRRCRRQLCRWSRPRHSRKPRHPRLSHRHLRLQARHVHLHHLLPVRLALLNTANGKLTSSRHGATRNANGNLSEASPRATRGQRCLMMSLSSAGARRSTRRRGRENDTTSSSSSREFCCMTGSSSRGATTPGSLAGPPAQAAAESRPSGGGDGLAKRPMQARVVPRVLGHAKLRLPEVLAGRMAMEETRLMLGVLKLKVARHPLKLEQVARHRPPLCCGALRSSAHHFRELHRSAVPLLLLLGLCCVPQPLERQLGARPSVASVLLQSLVRALQRRVPRAVMPA
mmetsp:Transcript_54824/g.177380  ORF Transcript_54824/g.177380 Transcript_54824/m.177380 type:complete len:348 (-) Transcript_54824:580-1623(-)